jgi:hypothetical protein
MTALAGWWCWGSRKARTWPGVAAADQSAKAKAETHPCPQKGDPSTRWFLA